MSKPFVWLEVQRAQGTGHVLTIGPVSAWVIPAWEGHNPLWAFEMERGGAPDVDGAKQRAEDKFREMHTVLTEHFALVLRWVDTECDSTAQVGGWELYATHCNWTLEHTSGARVFSPRPNRATRAENRLAAEAALRALGVTFRVEAE